MTLLLKPSEAFQCKRRFFYSPRLVFSCIINLYLVLSSDVEHLAFCYTNCIYIHWFFIILNWVLDNFDFYLLHLLLEFPIRLCWPKHFFVIIFFVHLNFSFRFIFIFVHFYIDFIFLLQINFVLCIGIKLVPFDCRIVPAQNPVLKFSSLTWNLFSEKCFGCKSLFREYLQLEICL